MPHVRSGNTDRGPTRYWWPLIHAPLIFLENVRISSVPLKGCIKLSHADCRVVRHNLSDACYKESINRTSVKEIRLPHGTTSFALKVFPCIPCT